MPICLRMKRIYWKILIALLLVAIGAIAWHFALFRAGDCLIQGGNWNWDNGFCRLDAMAQPTL